MLSVLFVAVSLGLLAQGILTPGEPVGGRHFQPGAVCDISWTADDTGTWTNAAIELMTGSDEAPVHLHTVHTFDGTSAAETIFEWTCPDVNPHQEIYFYRFTSDATVQDPTQIGYSGRFGIGNGDITAGPNQLPNGVTWGTGQLVGLVGTPAPPTAPGAASASNSDGVPTNTGPANTGSANWQDLGGAPATSAGADHALQGAGQNTRTATAPPITAKPVPNVNDYDSAPRQGASVLLAAAVAGGLAVLQWL